MRQGSMLEPKQVAAKTVVPTDAQMARHAELDKHVAHFKIPEPGGRFLKDVRIWGREEDVPRAKQFRDKIFDEEEKGLITPHQAMQLVEIVNRWIDVKEAYFASAEYQMRQLNKAFDAQQRNGKHLAEQPFDEWLAKLPDRSKNNGTQKK